MYLRFVAAVLGAILSLAVSASSALAGKLVALSIGVSNYTYINSLPDGRFEERMNVNLCANTQVVFDGSNARAAARRSANEPASGSDNPGWR